MGILNFLPLLGLTLAKSEGSMLTEILQVTSGKKAAVDASAIVHYAMQSLVGEAAEELAYALHSDGVFFVPEETKTVIRNRVINFERLVSGKLDCVPIMILDGQPFPGKAAEEQDRKERRALSFSRGVELRAVVEEAERRYNYLKGSAQGDSVKKAKADLAKAKKDMTSSFKASFYRHPGITDYFMFVLRERGIKYFVALYEADSQIAYLILTGACHLALVEDSDLAAYGASSLFGGIKFHKVRNNPNKFEVGYLDCSHSLFKEHTFKGRTYDMRGWTIQDVQALGNIMGSDYCTIEDVGLVKGFAIVETMVRFRKESNCDFGRALEHALEKHSAALGSLAPTQAYERIMKGMAGFNIQWVYNISNFEQQRLNPNWPVTAADEEKFGGPFPGV